PDRVVRGDDPLDIGQLPGGTSAGIGGRGAHRVRVERGAQLPEAVRRRMRVALFSGNYNYLREGANQALNRLVGDLGRSGHRVRVYSPVTETPAFEPEGELVPVPSIELPVRREFRLALGLPRAVREDVRRFDPDLFHVSTPDILGTRAQTFAKRLGVPVVASLHTRFETYFRYYGAGVLRPLAEAHLRRFYRRSDHVLAPTPAIVEEMKRLRG